MTLAEMLETHDEAALSALASVGLVRRATRDLAAGKATVMEYGNTATVSADGQTVTVSSEGPAAAQCGCPATAICRHIILAVLALRQSIHDAPSHESDQGQLASEEVRSLSEAELRKFAGADWDKSVRQALISTEARLAEEGTNLSIHLPDTEHPVVILAGLGLKGAIYKGPKTTKRRVVTAAALVFRAQSGAQSLERLKVETADEVLSAETLKAAQLGIADIVQDVLSGGSAIAEERLFDLSISTRAQAVPRLTALMRLLVRHAKQARTHHFSYNDTRFLSDAGLAYALTCALESSPLDPDLTGAIKRNYIEQDALALTVLGAVKWRAESGARGTRIYAVNPDTQQWYSTGQARAGGMDPSFLPQAVYSSPLWGLSTVRNLVGQSIRLNAPRVSKDNQIAWDGALARASGGASEGLNALRDADLLHDNWAQAREDLSRRIPRGLHWDGTAIPILLDPRRFDDASFDDISQVYRMGIRDHSSDALELVIPPEQSSYVDWLQRHQSTLAAMLCEVTFNEHRLYITPVTAFLQTGLGRPAQVSAKNFTLDLEDDDTKAGLSAFGGKALSLLKRSVTSSATGSQVPDYICGKCDGAFDCIAEVFRFSQSDRLERVISEVDSLGLGTLARALSDFQASKSPEDGLRASYIAGAVMRERNLLY